MPLVFRWILVELPPQEQPRLKVPALVCESVPLFCARRVLVCAHGCTTDHLHGVLPVAAILQRFQNEVPDPCNRPAPELPIDRTPLAEMLMQVEPWRALACDQEHSYEDQPMIRRWPAATLPCALQKRREERPFLIIHQPTDRGSLRSERELELRFNRFGNPLCQQNLDKLL